MARSLREMQTGRTLRVTRPVQIDDWLDGTPAPEFAPGMVVHEYKGATYGCVTSAGVAVTMEPGVTPFYEVPRDAVEDITDLVAVPQFIRDANRVRAMRALATGRTAAEEA